MAKRSRPAKQHGPYANVIKTGPAMWALDALRSWPGSSSNLEAANAHAERAISGGWSKRRNPICPECMIQKSLSGSCSCTE